MKKFVCLLLAIVMVFSLAGCGLFGSSFDASLYIQGSLECMYHGKTSDDFYKIVNFDSAYAKDMLADNVDIEFDYFTYWFEMYIEDLSEDSADALVAEGKQLLTEIYSYSKFNVESSEKQKNGDYIVNLTVTPMTIFDVYFAEYFEENYAIYEEAYYAGYNDDMSEEAYAEFIEAIEEMWIRNIYDDLKEIMAGGMPYGTPETVEVRVYKDTDDYYTISDSDVSKIDNLIIAYTSA